MTRKCIPSKSHFFLNTHRKLNLQAIFFSNVRLRISAKVNETILIVLYNHLVMYAGKDPYDQVQQLAFGFVYLAETYIFI